MCVCVCGRSEEDMMIDLTNLVEINVCVGKTKTLTGGGSSYYTHPIWIFHKRRIYASFPSYYLYSNKTFSHTGNSYLVGLYSEIDEID